MIHSSVIIPVRNAAEAVAPLLAPLIEIADRRGGETEILCVDHGSDAAQLRQLQTVLAARPQARLLRLDRPSGTSAAISTAIAAARGETIVALEASGQYHVEDIPRLLERLARADLVAGRRRRGPAYKAWQRVAQLPRRALLGIDAHDPDCLFWAARREAVQGLELSRGMHRLLPTLVSLRGFRVAELYVDHRHGQQARRYDGPPRLGDLLATWWWQRRWQTFTATELTGTLGQPRWDGADVACHGIPSHHLDDRSAGRGGHDWQVLAQGQAELGEP